MMALESDRRRRHGASGERVLHIIQEQKSVQQEVLDFH